MHSNRSVTRRRAAALAAGIVLVVLTLPTAVAARSAPAAAAAPVTPRDTFGWVAPTKAPPAINRAHAGRHVGVHFQLGGDFGLNVLAPGWPRAERIDCETGEPIPGTLWRTHPYGSAGLEYDSGSDTYTYVWDVRPEWGQGDLRCRRFILKTTGNAVGDVLFRFRSAPADEPPASLPCADIIFGEGRYASKDENDVPFPEPKFTFIYELAAPSCAPDRGLTTKYRLFVLPADAEGKPTSWMPIASQVVVGDGASTFVSFSIPVTEEPSPTSVCVYGDVVRGHAIIESVPTTPPPCFNYDLDGSQTGRIGWD